jgi:hypothetical protein
MCSRIGVSSYEMNSYISERARSANFNLCYVRSANKRTSDPSLSYLKMGR